MKMSHEQKKYIKHIKREKIKIRIIQILLAITLLSIYELFGRFNIINSFIYSYPTLIIKNLLDLFIKHNLLFHILHS